MCVAYVKVLKHRKERATSAWRFAKLLGNTYVSIVCCACLVTEEPKLTICICICSYQYNNVKFVQPKPCPVGVGQAVSHECMHSYIVSFLERGKFLGFFFQKIQMDRVSFYMFILIQEKMKEEICVQILCHNSDAITMNSHKNDRRPHVTCQSFDKNYNTKRTFKKKNELSQLNIYATPLFHMYAFHKTVRVWGPWSIPEPVEY